MEQSFTMDGKELLKYDTFLLLQGPKGFFFYNLAKFLKNHGKKVYKINFNGGDFITFPDFKGAYSFRDRIDNWESFLKRFIKEKEINAVLLYGDYKPYHKIAITLCKALEIPFYIFEEGYIRPHYITMERGGINGISLLPKDPVFYMNLPPIKIPDPMPNLFRFDKRAFSCILHYLFVELLRWRYPHYKFFKSYSPYSYFIFCQARSVIRKGLYKITESKYLRILTQELKTKYFLIPLQVFNDSQITIHSNFNSIEDYIYKIIKSFSKHASRQHYIVFKQHPVDRGFKNYRKFIEKSAKEFNISERVFYVHDLHLPTLIKNSIGVVVVNSTVGLQALYHNTPVKVMGRAIYDIPGLTFQGSLDEFWTDQGKIQRKLFRNFYNYVILTTQLNGSFYGRFPFSDIIINQ